MKKIMAMMITSDFDGWGGSHAGSVNTGMEIEEKLSGGSPPALSSGSLFRSCTALATSISQSTVYQSRLSDPGQSSPPLMLQFTPACSCNAGR